MIAVAVVHREFAGDYRAFVDEVKAIMRKRIRRCEPGDDPDPLLFFAHPDELVVVTVPHPFMQSSAAKRALVNELVLPMLEKGKPAKFAWSSAVWATRGDTPAGIEVNRRRRAGEPVPWLPDLGLDGVEEALVVTAFDAERDELWMAPILRSPRMAPSLGKWRMDGPPNSIEGVWADPIREAMR